MSKMLSSLTMKQIKSIKNIFAKYHLNLNINIEDKNILCLVKLAANPIWSEMKNKVPWMLEHKNKKIELIASATNAYIGLQLFRINNNIKIQDWQKDKDIVLLYLISDFILDDKDIDPKMKKDLLEKIRDRKINNKSKSVFREVNDLMDILDRLLTGSDKVKEAIFDAWDAEMDSLRQLTTLEFEELFKISKDKGIRTVRMASIILGKDFDSLYYDIGGISQLIDDLMDREIDSEDNINTAATICEDMDYYIYRLLILIDELSDHQYFFKISFIQILKILVKDINLSCEIGKFFHTDIKSKYSRMEEIIADIDI